MTNAERIVEIDAQIAELQREHDQSVSTSERRRLDAQIASLVETRQALEDAQNNAQFPPEGTGAGA
jgi:hypothetical protein